MSVPNSGRSGPPGAMRHRQMPTCRLFGTDGCGGDASSQSTNREGATSYRRHRCTSRAGIVCAGWAGMYPRPPSDRLLNELVARAREPMIVTDAAGAIRFENDAARRLTGHDDENRCGRLVVELIHADDRDRVRAALERASGARETGALVECRAHHVDGRELSLEIMVSPAVEDSGGTQLLLHVRDVSERLEMTARLRHAHKLASLGHLAIGLGDDLARVMATIRGQLDHLPASEAAPFFLRVVRNTAETGVALAQQMKAFAEMPSSFREAVDV